MERKILQSEYFLCESIKGISTIIENKTVERHASTLHTRFESGLIKDFFRQYQLYHAEYLYLIANRDCVERIGFKSAVDFVAALEAECMASDINLIMNSFTWNFCKGYTYSANDTRSEMGLINEVFRVRCAQRTGSAIYPYTVMKYDESLTHEDVS